MIHAKASKKHIIMFFIAIICLVVAVVVAADTNNDYSLLFLLPVTFGILSMIFAPLIRRDVINIGSLIIIAQLFIRNVLTPLIMCIGDYRTLFPTQALRYIPNAVFLMMYEMVCCAIALFFNNIRGWRIVAQKKRCIGNKKMGRILLAILLFCIVIWIFVPTVHGAYRSVSALMESQLKDNPFMIAQYAQSGTTNRILSTLFTVIFASFRVIFPAYVIVNIYNRTKKMHGLVLSLLIVATQFLFIPSAVAKALFPAILQMLLIISLYAKYRKSLIVLAATFTISFTVVIFSLNYSNAVIWYNYHNIWQYLSSWFVSYFTGVNNIASIYLMPQDNKFFVFLGTLIETIPFRSTILPSTLNMDTLVSVYTSLPGCSGQICSTIGSGQFFFTEAFAPLISIVFVCISRKYGDRYRNTQNPWKRIAYLYMAVQFAFGIGIYNLSITLINWIQVGIPLLLMGSLAGPDMMPSNTINSKQLIADTTEKYR